MSISELMIAVNSNISEPLNYNQYLMDIEMFKENSYVLAEENAIIFRKLILRSNDLLGCKSVRSIIYNKLTQEDVDCIILKHKNLGRMLNYFSNDVTNFTGHVIDDILQNITQSQLLSLPDKFKDGIFRYVDYKMAQPDVGIWLKSMFRNVGFTENQSLQDILLNDTCRALIRSDESVKMIFVCSKIFYENVDINLLQDIIPNIIKLNLASGYMLDTYYKNGKILLLLNNQTILNAIISNKESLKLIIENAQAFAELIKLSNFTQLFTTNNILYTEVVKALQDYVTGKKLLTGIKENTTSISNNTTQLDRLLYCENSIAQTVNCAETSLVQINKVLDLLDIVMKNVSTILKNDNIKEVFETANSDFLELLFSDENVCKAFCEKNGPLLYYCTNYKHVIVFLLKTCKSFVKYLQKNSKTTSAMSYTGNGTNLFIILEYEWEWLDGSSDFYTAAKKYYKYVSRKECSFVEGFYYLDEKITAASGFKGSLNILFEKDGYFEMNASKSTLKKITYYLIE